MKRILTGLALLGFLLPASGLLDQALDLDRPAALALGIVLAALLLWVGEVVPLFVTGAGVALLGATTLAPVLGVPPETFVAPFASDMTLLFLGGFVLSEVMRQEGLDAALARVVLDRVGTAPPRALAGILGTTAALSFWMSNSAAAAVMLSLVAALTEGRPAGDSLRRVLVLGVAAGANFGGMGTPVGSPPNAVALASLARVGQVAPTFLTWMLLTLPVVAVALYGAWRVLGRGLPPDLAELALPAPSSRAVSPLAAGLVLATVFLWMTAGLHPLSPGTVGLLPVLVAFGSGLLPPEGLRNLPWEVLGVVGGGLCLGVVVDASELDRWLVERLPIGGLGQAAVGVAFVLLATTLSSLMSNTAAANLVLPLAVAVPGAGLPLALGVALACSVAMPLPISTPPNTLAFAASGLDAPEFTRWGLRLTGLGLGAVLGVGLPLWALHGWWWG